MPPANLLNDATDWPTTCISDCLTSDATKRFAGITAGNKCHCYAEMPHKGLVPVPEEECRAPGCSGDVGHKSQQGRSRLHPSMHLMRI